MYRKRNKNIRDNAYETSKKKCPKYSYWTSDTISSDNFPSCPIHVKLVAQCETFLTPLNMSSRCLHCMMIW